MKWLCQENILVYGHLGVFNVGIHRKHRVLTTNIFLEFDTFYGNFLWIPICR